MRSAANEPRMEEPHRTRFPHEEQNQPGPAEYNLTRDREAASTPSPWGQPAEQAPGPARGIPNRNLFNTRDGNLGGAAGGNVGGNAGGNGGNGNGGGVNRTSHPVQTPAPASQPFQPGIQGANTGSPWKIDHKVPKNLNLFDGKFENYKVWKSMVEDHLIRCNSDWFHVLAVIEKEKTRLTMDRIGNSSLIPGTDARILATELYAFLGTMLTPSLHKRRLRLVGGERGNGMELRRKLCELNEGGERCARWRAKHNSSMLLISPM